MDFFKRKIKETISKIKEVTQLQSQQQPQPQPQPQQQRNVNPQAQQFCIVNQHGLESEYAFTPDFPPKIDKNSLDYEAVPALEQKNQQSRNPSGRIIQVEGDSYEFTKIVLGRGNFGKVKLARNINTNRLVAVKVLYKETSYNDEVNNISKLKVIPNETGKVLANYASLVDFGRKNKRPTNKKKFYIFSRYMHKGDARKLKDQIAQCDSFEKKCDFLLPIAYDILTALEHIHGEYIFHLDIKPENILHRENTSDNNNNNNNGSLESVLADFGCSKESRDAKISGGTGDWNYFSPQRLECARYAYHVVEDGFFRGIKLKKIPLRERPYFFGDKEDLWAFGLTLIELLFFINPFQYNEFKLLLCSKMPDEKKFKKYEKNRGVIILKENSNYEMICWNQQGAQLKISLTDPDIIRELENHISDRTVESREVKKGVFERVNQIGGYVCYSFSGLTSNVDQLNRATPEFFEKVWNDFVNKYSSIKQSKHPLVELIKGLVKIDEDQRISVKEALALIKPHTQPEADKKLYNLMMDYKQNKTEENLSSFANCLESIQNTSIIGANTFGFGNTLVHIALQEQLFEIAEIILVCPYYNDFSIKNAANQTILEIAENLLGNPSEIRGDISILENIVELLLSERESQNLNLRNGFLK